MKKFNKKFLLIFIVLGVPMVLALTYVTLFTATFSDVRSAIVGGEIEQTFEGIVFTEEPTSGTPGTITNNAPSEREVEFVVDSNCEVVTSYEGDLELTQKDSEWVPTEVKKTISYTVIGDSFKVTGVPEGYTAIYYKDSVVELGERIVNPQPVILIADVGNVLPEGNDANNAEDADYCNNGVDNYKTCKGGKIWAVPNVAILEGNVLDWSLMSQFYFETDLVEYKQQGKITIYPGKELTVTPIYEFARGVEAPCNVKTTVA